MFCSTIPIVSLNVQVALTEEELAEANREMR